MESGINLIKLEAKKTVQLMRLRRRVKKLTLFFFFFFVLLSLLTFGALFLISNFSQKNQSKIAQLKGQIRSMEKTESYLVIIADRVKGVNLFLKNRHSYSRLLEDLQSLLVPGFSVKEMQIDNRGKLMISGYCRDLSSATALNEQIDKINQKKVYSKINYPSLARLSSGGWEVSLELEEK